MGMIRCFWIEPMPLAEQSLRRFVFSDKRPCPAKPNWGCDASVRIEDIAVPAVWMDTDRSPHHRIGGRGYIPTPEEILAEQRWPTNCEACGQPFQPGDNWQRNVHQYYTDAQGSGRWTLHWQNMPPPGAMWHSYWMDDIYAGPDGRSLTVMTPGGEWNIDGGASNSPAKQAWTRTGVAPDLVVSPSIDITGKYHGWLGNGGAPPGWLKEC